MANKIQIKRSVSNSTVTGLANGELAFTQASNTLWIGLPDGSGTVSIAGARYPGVLTANQALVANATSEIDKIIVANLVPTSIWANGTFGSFGQILSSNGTHVYWTDQTPLGVTNLQTANGIGGGPITTTGTIYILSNNGIVANSSGVFAKAGVGVAVDENGISIGQSVSPSDNVTFAGITATNMTITENLIVSGTTTTVNSVNITIRDNMIGLSDTQNDTSVFLDYVDSGFFVSTGNTSTSFYSGLARIASQSTNTNPYLKVFSSAQLPNSSAIDTNASTGTLQAFLSPWGVGGAFVVNSSSVSVNSNTTVSVNFSANSLSLSAPLQATSGGTGYNSYSVGDLLVGASGSTLSKVAIGGSGYLLQSNGTTLVYDYLDGGIF